MLLRRKYRDRAIGLIGAYAVLIGGVIASGSFEPAPPAIQASPQQATEAALDPHVAKKNCADNLEGRSEIVC